jgi:hypothetical protein
VRIGAGRDPPRTACLDEYGAEFPEFPRRFEPAVTLVYLADVARLEWAVSRAIHIADVEPLDLTRLAALSPQGQTRVRFVPHSSVGLLCADYPIVAIWRGALDGDDAALAAVALDAGPSRLLVERRARDRSLDEAAWCFAAALFDGWSVEEALAGAAGTPADALLAEHLDFLSVNGSRDAHTYREGNGCRETDPARSQECIWMLEHRFFNPTDYFGWDELARGMRPESLWRRPGPKCREHAEDDRAAD